MIELIIIAVVVFTIYGIASGTTWTRTHDEWVGPHRVFVEQTRRGRVRVILFINGNPVRQVYRDVPVGFTAQDVVDDIISGL